ncbi:MAG: ABC transporter ATP-binding protein [Oceanospirillaceae bacterium]|uniref:ATP-binding cassette domain-containing protein n=1 Tax=unclassified Thalassolituus TaxID=2624967 RepID=UPI000C536ECC|nr:MULTISPECIES: ATP-binding cassette domain-containing protein [unclassified Thalassolituus]MAY01305.1 ABC transporter ATP-binding protein [Oceanospirillaceae bacterium]MBS51310.1 ABC transporter ATP-binding protein [Oceanospirillaceae bacterium]|tara:strand:+ start:726 stop:2645 length:1920 start_codon:yes stop_codon:yes gene_type:complete
MVLVSLKQAELAFGDHVLLDKVNLDIHTGERLCVVGRNGEGKSTLLKILNRQIQPDDGRVEHLDMLRVSALQQELPQAADKPVYDVVADGLGEVGQLISRYHDETARGADADMKVLEDLQTRIEAADGWSWQQKVDAIIQRLKLPGETSFAQLSGGWQRRVMLARALVVEPDLLILDEPTNHMDVATIEWLEEQLKQFNGSLVFISHDRAFVQNLATRIIELDRGHIYNWQGDYLSFVDYREKRLEEEATQNALFDKRLAEEEKWIRKGIEARRTRNEGRVRALKAMRNERRARRDVQGSANISMNAAESSGKQVFEIEHLTYAWKDVMQVKDFSTLVMRGDRIGLVGPNGVGKSTLLKLLLGQLQPQSGTIKSGTKIEVAYFDQARHLLDDEKSIADNVADGKDQVEVNGQSRHIIGYLGDFLFSAQRARTPVKALSGGERNRVLLAKLFLKPCNLLVMDEPTNDLDVETLELLEERLMEYSGTLLLVSHDRAFLDNVVTQMWVFGEGEPGYIEEQVGGYSDWQERKKAQGSSRAVKAEEEKKAAAEKKADTAPVKAEESKSAGKKLSYKLQRELDMLPDQIAAAEAERDALAAKAGEPDFYSGDADAIQKTLEALSAAEAKIEALEERWLELEEMAS